MAQRAQASSAQANSWASPIEFNTDLDRELVQFNFETEEVAEAFGALLKQDANRGIGRTMSATWPYVCFLRGGPVDDQIYSKVIKCVAKYLLAHGQKKSPTPVPASKT